MGKRYPNEIKSSQSGKRILIKLNVILVIQISYPLVFLFLLHSYLALNTPTVPLWSFVNACVCVCMMSGGRHTCQGAHVEVRGQLQRVTSALGIKFRSPGLYNKCLYLLSHLGCLPYPLILILLVSLSIF